jgi:hypothetical protein
MTLFGAAYPMTSTYPLHHRHLDRKRSVELSITDNSRPDDGAQLDVSEARQAAPHHRIAGRRRSNWRTASAVGESRAYVPDAIEQERSEDRVLGSNSDSLSARTASGERWWA